MFFHVSHKWIVFVAALSVAFFDYGIVSSLGGLYIAMLDTFNAGRSKTAFVQSLLFTFCWGFGVISGLLISRFGIKIVAYCAAVFTGAGFILSYFAVSIYQLYGFISMTLGTGGATMYIAAVLSVERSFTGKQKSIALSVQSIGTAISGFVWPSLFSVSLESYSLRGTFLILGGLFLNNFAFAIIFAETGQQDKTGGRIEEHKLYGTSDHVTEMSSMLPEAELMNNTECVIDGCELKTEKHHEKSVDRDEYVKTAKPKTNYDKGAVKNSQSALNENDRMQNFKHSVNGSNGSIDEFVNSVTAEIKPDAISYTKVVNDFTDYKSPVSKSKTEFEERSYGSLLCLYLTYTLACILHMSTLAGFVTLYQDINISNGLSIAQSDLTFMVYSLFNILSRLLPIIPAHVQNIHSFTIPILSSMCAATGQMILLFATPSMSTTTTAMVLSGIADGGWTASMQVILFEILPKEKQAVGFGFVLTAMGVVSAAIGPLFGLSRDDSTSYQTVLIISTATFSASALLVCVCLFKSKRLRS